MTRLHLLPWYLTLGVTTAAVNLAAAVAVHRDEGAPRAASLPSKAAGLLVIGHLLASSQAGPNMVKASRTDAPQALEEALAGFGRWHGVRRGLDVLTFGAGLWSLVSVHRSGRQD